MFHVEQSIGRSWVFVGISREIWDLRDGTPPNKGKHLQTRKNLSKQGETPPNRGKHQQTRGNTSKQGKTPPNKEKPFQTRGNLSKQGKTFPNKGKHHQTRGNLSKQGRTFPNKKKHHQTRETPFEQGKRLSSKGYLPIKCKSLQVVGVSRQGKAVVGDAEGTKGKRGRRWRGVGPAGRPFPILLWR